MGILSYILGTDINQGLREYSAAAGAHLIDVRTSEEYRLGHIPGGVNIPLAELGKISKAIDDRGAPIYVYCQSGARSCRAAAMLKEMGYKNVKNIGGMAAYSGRVER